MREAVLAAETSVAWPFTEWWSQLTADPTWATAAAAAAAAVVAVALIVLAVRQVRPWRRGGGQVEFGDCGESRAARRHAPRSAPCAGASRKTSPA